MSKDALSKRSRRPKPFGDSDAITAHVVSEQWQLGEIQKAITELDHGQEVRHEIVAKWLKSWEDKSPKMKVICL